MGASEFLLRIARSVVNSVLQTIAQQVRRIEDVVQHPLEAAVKTYIGPFWRGEGADRFAEEMGSEVIPNLVNLVNVTSNYHMTLGRAVEIMNEAEKKATQQASMLNDVFQKIYQ